MCVCMHACECGRVYVIKWLLSLHSFKEPSWSQSPGSSCKPCPVVHPSPVCGADGHSYSTKVAAHTDWIYSTQGPFNHSDLSSVSVAQCKLDYQACITGKKIAVRCPGMCPCPAQLQMSATEKTGIYLYLWLHFTDVTMQLLIWSLLGFATPQFAVSWTWRRWWVALKTGLESFMKTATTREWWSQKRTVSILSCNLSNPTTQTMTFMS